MKGNFPRRFSIEWWLWFGVAAVLVGVVTYFALEKLDIFQDRMILGLVAVGFALVSDIMGALTCEFVAPGRVTVGPAEKARYGQDVTERATVVAGFDRAPSGRVRIRGEVWAARNVDDAVVSLNMGSRVKVIDRDGLTLIIDGGKPD